MKRFAIFGTGFWSRYQLAAWQELTGAKCVALYNRTLPKAQKLADEFAVPSVYDNPEALLDNEQLDFVDIITDVDTHRKFSEMVMDRGLAAICQKPIAPSLSDAQAMLDKSAATGKPLFIHENWRWQTPIRALKTEMDSGKLGKIWRARVIYNNSFPVFENQPFLKELEQFILTDIGTHILDVVRFLFGEAQSLQCHTHRVNRTIKGEDAATVLLKMKNGITVTTEMSYSSRWSGERFPQTYLIIEGEDSSLELTFDYWIKFTDRHGTTQRRVPPEYYSWADARYDLVHSSIVACNRNLLGALNGECCAETSAEDNFQTLRLVYSCYESAASGSIVKL